MTYSQYASLFLNINQHFGSRKLQGVIEWINTAKSRHCWQLSNLLLLFINTSMTYNPTVSQFTLNQEQQHVPPHLIRSRNRYQRTNKIYHPHHHISLRPQQVIIDVSLNNALNTSIQEKEQQNRQGIRKHIDACLNAIETAYAQNKKKKAASIQQNQPIIDDRTIHRIDTNLVLEYTRAICKDYKLRDRFGNYETQINMLLSHQKQSETLSPSNRQRTQSVGPLERSRKQYLNVTQNSKLDRKGFSTQKKRIEQPTSPRSHQLSHSIHQSPQVTSHRVKLGQSTNVRAFNSPKIQQDFRYCINCESLILSRNVDYHQKYECKNFSSLYQLSFSQLTAMVGQKVSVINRQLKRKLQKLKEKDLSKSRAENICNQTLDRIEDYLNESSLNSSFDKTNQQYQKFTDSLNNEYGQVVKLTHKLHWFNKVYLNLKNQCQKRRESSRVLQLSRFTPTIPPPVYQQAGMVPPSPISQLHPYLHRQTIIPPRTFNQST